MNEQYPIHALPPNDFPALLKEIPDPPKRLFVRGSSLSFDEYTKFLCVVGSRKYSPYGKAVCEKLIAGLRGYPVCVVSGLALGIDAVAHKAALDAGLRTIAIPGSGLGWSVLHPRAHALLARRIIECGGALATEYEAHEKAAYHTFPRRNRIMAGMSHATLVIEAEVPSGTLITAKLATEYNRDVLTVPGSVLHTTSDGPHMLIRLGATPIRNSADILDALGIKTKESCATSDVAQLSRAERGVWDALAKPLPRDELLRRLDLPTQEVNILLSTMEIRGIIREHLGMLYRK